MTQALKGGEGSAHAPRTDRRPPRAPEGGNVKYEEPVCGLYGFQFQIWISVGFLFQKGW